MKILIFTDTHRYIENAVSAVKRTPGVTDILHLGDLVMDAEELQILFPQINVRMVAGNNDFTPHVKDELLFEACGHRLFATHGHAYGVKRDLSRLAEKAKSVGADIALFGHTHQMHDSMEHGVRLMNPSPFGYIVIDDTKIEVKKY